MTGSKIDGFRLGIYVFEDAEVMDFAAPYGVFSVARRYDPALDVFLVAETLRPVQAQAGFTVLPNYDFVSRPAMNAFLIPGGAGTYREDGDGGAAGRQILAMLAGFPVAPLGVALLEGARRGRAAAAGSGSARSMACPAPGPRTSWWKPPASPPLASQQPPANWSRTELKGTKGP